MKASKLNRSVVKLFAAVALCASLNQAGMAAFMGINFPPTQGSSGTGAFLAGIYNYNYSNTDIKNSHTTFDMERIAINVATANDPASLTKIKGYVDQFNGYAIICMFDTLQSGQSGHGDGLPNNLAQISAAWKKINAVFASYGNVHYEIFNEPFGYNKNNPVGYVNDMKTIIAAGGLPNSKCILDGMGYADNINLVASGGWAGDLAYHFYPTWSNTHTQSDFSNRAQTDLGSWGQNCWVTEFGANLGWTSAYGYANTCYDVFVDGNQPCSADVNCLRGLDDGLRALKAHGHGVKGAFVFHGWSNGDTYSYWPAWNSSGACKVITIEAND